MITRVVIRNYRGIEALEIEPGPAGTVAKGRNGSGKTSFLKAVRAALAAQDIGPDAIRQGAESAEILVDIDDVSVRRAITPKASTLSVSKDKFRAPKPQGYLSELLGTSPLDPMDLLMLKSKDRKKKILEALPVRLTVEQLRQWWPKCPDDFDVSGHGLEVLEGLRGKAYDKRTAANRLAKDARAEAETLKKAATEAASASPLFPPDVGAASDRANAARDILSSLRARQEEASKSADRTSASRARSGLLRSNANDARVGAKERAVPKEDLDKQQALKDEIQREVGALKQRLIEAQTRLEIEEDILSQLVESHEQSEDLRLKAEGLDREAQSIEETIAAATVEPVPEDEYEDAAKTAALTAQALEDARKAAAAHAAARSAGDAAMAAEAKALTAEAEASRLDAFVRVLSEDAPKALLAQAEGIPGLSLEGDDVRLDGVSLDALCGAEQVRFAVQIAKRANCKTKILVVDGLERLDPDAYDEFVREATSDGWQLLASRVDRGDIVLESLSLDAAVEAAE